MRILVVEDNERIAQTLADVLEDQHYIVGIALDGEVGWQQAEAFNHSLPARVVLKKFIPFRSSAGESTAPVEVVLVDSFA